MNGPQLNLTRKWRSKSFDQVIGQPLPIRMLKNSLYLENFFPVYLFAGQRGCGKTTMARVFAAAVNCHKLVDFQKSPKNNSIPCLACDSCIAMNSGHHADFIEIDAASHTGVDNVRNIIDAASLMPVMGRKKIYLIDEAHMLSKAAFNAFLKILEEPPLSALFILATTDAEKIIDTVRSRCFQLFFSPVQTQPLLDHLSAICVAESIHHEKDGLKLIVDSTQGSVRDAINLLEQVRFSTSSVTKQAVLLSLGYLDDDRLLDLFRSVLSQSPGQVLEYWAKHKLNLYSAEFLWHKVIDMIRATIWIKYGAQPQHFTEYSQQLQKIAGSCTFERLYEMLDAFYQNESVFKKTTGQHALLEMIFLKISQKNRADDNSGSSSIVQHATATSEDMLADQECDEDCEDDVDEDEEIEDDQDAQSSFLGSWAVFLRNIPTLKDELLNSIFSQGVCKEFDSDTARLSIIFPKEFVFFKDMLEKNAPQWQPLLDKSFGASIKLQYQFAALSSASANVIPQTRSSVESAPKAAPAAALSSSLKNNNTVAQVPAQQAGGNQYKKQDNKSYNSFRKNSFARSEPLHPRIDVSDKAFWKKTNLLLDYFPGVVREIKETVHEQKS